METDPNPLYNYDVMVSDNQGTIQQRIEDLSKKVINFVNSNNEIQNNKVFLLGGVSFVTIGTEIHACQSICISRLRQEFSGGFRKRTRKSKRE